MPPKAQREQATYHVVSLMLLHNGDDDSGGDKAHRHDPPEHFPLGLDGREPVPELAVLLGMAIVHCHPPSALEKRPRRAAPARRGPEGGGPMLSF